MFNIKSKRFNIIFLIVIFIFSAFSAGVLFIKKQYIKKIFVSSFLKTEKNITTQKSSLELTSDKFVALLFAQLETLEVKKNEIEVSKKDNNITSIKAFIPLGKPFEIIIWQLDSLSNKYGYILTDCKYNEKKKNYELIFSNSARKNRNIKLYLSNSSRYFKNTALFSLIIEDLEGIDYKTCVSILSVPIDFTVSIVPLDKKSQLIGQLAEQYKKEIVIRFPLEPIGKIPDEYKSKTIFIHYPEEKIISIINNEFNIIPKASGVSNLWGGRAMEDSRLMSIILKEVKKHRCYFIEVPLAKNSVVPSICNSLNLKYLKVEGVFQKTTENDLTSELRHYILIAHNKGRIAVVCSAQKPVGNVLSKWSSIFEQYGIKAVFASEIIK